MRRRPFIRAALGGAAVGLAGCVEGKGAGDESPGSANGGGRLETGIGRGNGQSDGSSDPGSAARPIVDVDLPLDDSDLTRAARPAQIPAITDPAFASDWAGVPATLGDDEPVIGVAADGTARAYPLAILNWHEVVNDRFGGPLLVTYCPLCGSGVTAVRRVDGEATDFLVSGYLWQRDLVLSDDRTDSLWSQLLARAVRGPQTGERLALRPSVITTWAEWRRDYPDSAVLLPPPESGTVTGRSRGNYDTNPYSEYESYNPPDIGGTNRSPLTPKTQVLGVATPHCARAYPLASVLDAGGVVNDTVGAVPVVVATTEESLVAYDRRVDGDALTFERTAKALVAGGSHWGLAAGRALDGPSEGAVLRRATDRSPMFWFAWSSFYPETSVYGRGA
jgi:hypothetical protein